MYVIYFYRFDQTRNAGKSGDTETCTGEEDEEASSAYLFRMLIGKVQEE